MYYYYYYLYVIWSESDLKVKLINKTWQDRTRVTRMANAWVLAYLVTPYHEAHEVMLIRKYTTVYSTKFFQRNIKS